MSTEVRQTVLEQNDKRWPTEVQLLNREALWESPSGGFVEQRLAANSAKGAHRWTVSIGHNKQLNGLIIKLEFNKKNSIKS